MSSTNSLPHHLPCVPWLIQNPFAATSCNMHLMLPNQCHLPTILTAHISMLGTNFLTLACHMVLDLVHAMCFPTSTPTYWPMSVVQTISTASYLGLPQYQGAFLACVGPNVKDYLCHPCVSPRLVEITSISPLTCLISPLWVSICWVFV